MIKATYHDFRLLRWVICPVCPTQTRDITSSGWVRTGSGGGRAGFGFGLPCSTGGTPMIMTTAFPPVPIAPVVIMGRWLSDRHVPMITSGSAFPDLLLHAHRRYFHDHRVLS